MKLPLGLLFCLPGRQHLLELSRVVESTETAKHELVICCGHCPCCSGGIGPGVLSMEPAALPPLHCMATAWAFSTYLPPPPPPAP